MVKPTEFETSDEVYITWTPYKTYTEIWKWMLAPLKEGWKYLNLWKKNSKNDSPSY